MSTRLTVTLGVCLAAGVAAGIGLARPGPGAGSAIPAPASSDSAATGATGSGGYGSSPAPGDAPATGAPAQPAVVTIEGFAFSGLAGVAPGTTVEVINVDGTDHTLTAEDRAFDTGNLAGGGRGSFTAPGQPGTYRFFCAIHPSMEGTLTVAA